MLVSVSLVLRSSQDKIRVISELTDSDVCVLTQVKSGDVQVSSACVKSAINTACNTFCFLCQEVITHERVVAMMKAAIRDTQDFPMFVSFHVFFLSLVF